MKTGFLRSICTSLLLGLSIAAAPLCVTLARADNIGISASVNKNSATLDDQITLEVNVNGNVSNLPNPTLPDMSNFSVYSSGRSQSLSIINGQMSSSVLFHYTLVPKNVGKFTLNPITIQYDNKTYQTSPIEIEIVAAGSSPRQGSSQGSAPAPAAAAAAAERKDLFITASVDKAAAYVNEQVVYTFKFYRRIRLLANPQYTPASFTGFWTEDTAPKNYYNTINGAQYVVTEVKTLLFPTKPGKFNLGSASLQCSVEDFNQGDPSSDQFFASFFSGAKTQVVHTNPVSINVLPLPADGKPAGFSGAVGQFNITASVDKRSVRANEPVTLTVTISGTGNIKTVSDPVLPDWQDFKKYETASTLNINKDGDIMKGSKEFKTIIVPLTSGPKTIKPLTLSYFDTRIKTYRTVSTDAITLDVKPAAAGSSPANAAQMLGMKNDINILNSDIRYIKTAGSGEVFNGYLYRKNWFMALNAFPLVFLGLFLGYVKWQEKLTGDVAFARRLRASSTAKKFLKKAKTLLSSGAKPEDYYNAISRAVLEFIANKTNVSPDGLVTASIGEILSAKKVSEETISKVTKLLDECNLVRFAPTSVTPDMMKDMFEETGETISRLEKEMR